MLSVTFFDRCLKPAAGCYPRTTTVKTRCYGFGQTAKNAWMCVDVFFDELTITYKPALSVQENHYSPWGSNLVGIEKTGSPDHKFQYLNREKQSEFGLNWLDLHARNYDPQLGRFHSIDPLADEEEQERWTPYHYSLNNPVLHSDPDGKNSLLGALIGAGLEIATQVTVNYISDKPLTDIDWGDVAVSGVMGAATSGISTFKNIGTTIARIAKASIDIAGEGIKAAVDVKTQANGGTQTVMNGKKDIKTAAVDLVAGKGGGLTGRSAGRVAKEIATSRTAVKAATAQVKQAANYLSKAFTEKGKGTGKALLQQAEKALAKAAKPGKIASQVTETSSSVAAGAVGEQYKQTYP